MLRRLLILAAVALVCAAVAGCRDAESTAPKTVPTLHVQRGRVQVTVYTVGDLLTALGPEA